MNKNTRFIRLEALTIFFGKVWTHKSQVIFPIFFVYRSPVLRLHKSIWRILYYFTDQSWGKSNSTSDISYFWNLYNLYRWILVNSFINIFLNYLLIILSLSNEFCICDFRCTLTTGSGWDLPIYHLISGTYINLKTWISVIAGDCRKIVKTFEKYFETHKLVQKSLNQHSVLLNVVNSELDIYEKHFTVMNYTPVQLKQMYCQGTNYYC